jgi:WD40 repeat protein
MTLTLGSRLGPYVIVAPLGAGGMGEVFRARDTRLQREVALKVLPESVVGDPLRLARFEREAQALAALAHPNVLGIHDFGTDQQVAYAVTELLEGETLRDRLADGPLTARKAVEIAGQVARGLAAAHEKGLVHRDLKPENIFITRDGRVKVLDFGLARSTETPANQADETLANETTPGTVLGTIGYMSPEQVRGASVDQRSDIFSFGALLYEMITGRRAFGRDSPADTMSAILKEDPEPIATHAPSTPPALERVVHHCLEKRADERFQSARDLAFALEQSVSGASMDRVSSSPAHPVLADAAVPPPASRRTLLPWIVAAAMLVAGIAAGFAAARTRTASAAAPSEPVFTRLTFGRGSIRSARFAPDGKTVVYGAAWDGNPIKVFFARTESSESTPLSFPPAEMLAVSAGGELALSLGHVFDGWMGDGTLARAPMLGAGPRPLVGAVREADWTPDGSELAIVRRIGGRERLELPLGHVLYETTGWIGSIRVSPDGQQVAFADHPVFADDIGTVAMADRNGKKRDLSTGWDSMLRGLAWSPDGREVWFTASHGGEDSALRAVDLEGRVRPILSGLARVIIFDIAPDGRVLLGRETFERRVEALTPDSTQARDFSLSREQSMSRHMAGDGKTVVVVDQSTRGYATYLRASDGSPPVRLGTGEGHSLSPDGAWVSTVTAAPPMKVVLLPTGPGDKLTLPNSDEIVVDLTRWLPDGKHLVVFGPTPKAPSRGYVQALDGTPPKPFTPPGVEVVKWWATPVSPDGSRVIARGLDGTMAAYPVAGGNPEPLAHLAPDALPIEYTADGKAVFVGHRTATGWSVRRYDLATGHETPWKDIVANDLAGLRLSQIYITPDGRSYVHSYSRLLVDLYVAQGLR